MVGELGVCYVVELYNFMCGWLFNVVLVDGVNVIIGEIVDFD